MLLVVRRKVNFLINHSKIQKDSTLKCGQLKKLTHDQVKSVMTLCSGKAIEKPILKPCKKNNESIFKGKEEVEPEHCKEKIDSLSILLFSHAITNQRKMNHNSKTFAIFKEVKINIHVSIKLYIRKNKPTLLISRKIS